MLFMTDDFEVFDKSTYDGLNKYSDMKNYLIIRKQNGSIYIKSLDEYHDNGVHVKISGKGNIIIFEEPIFFRNSLISISSNYNLIHYSWTRRMVINYIYISDGDNQLLNFGTGFSAGKTVFSCHEEFSSILVGDDCMFSADIFILNSDCHLIYKMHDKPILNMSKNIEIGNHVWVGRNCMLLKNTKIADNCIVAASSTVVGNLLENNSIYGGNPAKLIVNNINWERKSVSKYIKELIKNEINNDLLKRKIKYYNNLKNSIYNNFLSV